MTKFTNRKEIRYVCGNRLGFHIFIISACSRNVKYILTKIRSYARQLFARCRGGDSRARRCTPDPYRLSLKWHAPIASVAAVSDRLWQLQIWRYFRRMCKAPKLVIARALRARGNLAVPGWIVGQLSAKTQLPSRDCHGPVGASQ